ncbi:MAG: TAXI family TRAP transporter solute-binding subunit [Rhodospirillales bacterium]
MKIVRWATLAAAAAALAAPAAAQTISIGTSPVGSLNNSVGSALGKVLGDEYGLRTRVVPYGGGQQFLPLINSKELEMAIPSSTDAQFAFAGKGDFEGKPNPQLRMIATVFPFYLGYFVKKDAPYKTLADLKGKKIAVGYKANSAQRRIAEALLAVNGVTEGDFNGVPVPHVVRGADDFMQGTVEATTFAAGAGKVAEADAKVGGIRYLDNPDDAGALQRLRTQMPSAYVGTVNPSPELAGVVKPTKMVLEDYTVLTGTQLSNDDAYKVAQVLYEHQGKLAKIAATWGKYEPAKLSVDRGVPFHNGAIKYYTEKGIWPPKS